MALPTTINTMNAVKLANFIGIKTTMKTASPTNERVIQKNKVIIFSAKVRLSVSLILSIDW